jgi:hypothetical protein
VGRHIHGAALFPDFLVLKWGEQPSEPLARAGQWIVQTFSHSLALQLTPLRVEQDRAFLGSWKPRKGFPDLLVRRN